MFFRPAQLQEIPSSLANQNLFILENQEGILGKVILNESNISFLEINQSYFLIFLEMIEEYLFMKYNKITIIKFNDSLTLPNDWIKNDSVYIKEKNTSTHKKYTMIVQGISRD